MGVEIDSLTEEQARYLASWDEGPRASRDRAPEPRLSSSSTSADCLRKRSSWSAARRPRSPTRIRTLAVRGAPAIGIAAAYGYALACARGRPRKRPRRRLASCPTAVNLPWAIAEMRRGDQSLAALAERARGAARRGGRLLPPHGGPRGRPAAPGTRALTHCNAGALATGRRGRRSVPSARGSSAGSSHMSVDDAAAPPGLQADRVGAGAGGGPPGCVVADSAAGSLMARGEVDAVLTGADRIAANGDGQQDRHLLAVLAAHHELPFYVVAPSSTVDLAAGSGADIPIEERDPAEVTARFPARNPAFDATLAELIAAVVTEEGVHRAPYQESLAGLGRTREEVAR